MRYNYPIGFRSVALLLGTFVAVISLEAQDTTQDSLLQRIKSLESRVQRLDQAVSGQQGRISNLDAAITTQSSVQKGLADQVARHDTLLGEVRTEADTLKGRTTALKTTLNDQGNALDGRLTTLAQRTGLHWTITLLLVGLLLGLLVLAYLGLKGLLGKRVGAVGAEVQKLSADVQTKLVKVDAEFITALEKMLETKPLAQSPAAAEEDHSLALKVADEITRIEQNLAQMDPAVKGHKQLSAAVKRMNENLVAAGYQVPELLGKPYDDGMKLSPTFVPDDTLADGERRITRVYKPTVLFKGKMIQAGEVQVAQG